MGFIEYFMEYLAFKILNFILCFISSLNDALINFRLFIIIFWIFVLLSDFEVPLHIIVILIFNLIINFIAWNYFLEIPARITEFFIFTIFIIKVHLHINFKDLIFLERFIIFYFHYFVISILSNHLRIIIF